MTDRFNQEENKDIFSDELMEKVYPWVKVAVPDSDDSEEKTIRTMYVCLPTREWLADLVILYVVDMGDRFQVVLYKNLPPEYDEQMLYEKACSNLIRDVEFTLQQTNYGASGVIAGGNHEAGALCIPEIWDSIADIIGEDFIISVPAKDIVTIVKVSDKEAFKSMKEHCLEIYNGGDRRLTKHLFLYSINEHKFSVIEDTL